MYGAYEWPQKVFLFYKKYVVLNEKPTTQYNRCQSIGKLFWRNLLGNCLFLHHTIDKSSFFGFFVVKVIVTRMYNEKKVFCLLTSSKRLVWSLIDLRCIPFSSNMSKVTYGKEVY